jgi:hypothetical protein
MWKFARVLIPIILFSVLGANAVQADCQIGDAKLEEAILQNPKFRGPANRQSVRDLRRLRDAAFTLWSYGRMEDCERLLDNIRTLSKGPSVPVSPASLAGMTTNVNWRSRPSPPPLGNLSVGTSRPEAQPSGSIRALLRRRFFGSINTMKNPDPRQLELFSDGARAVAAAKRPKPPRPTEADLQARLDAARQRLHEIVILRMKTWIREETRRGLREAQDWLSRGAAAAT